MSGYHDLEAPYASACATQDARDAFFDEHISLNSVAAKSLMELCSFMGFDFGADAMNGELEQSLGDDGIPHEEHEAAEEQIDSSIGTGPAKWLKALTRAVEAQERKNAKAGKLALDAQFAVGAFIVGVMA